MGSTSVTPFTGSSQFASQLQQVIATAVTRASAPLTELQSQQTTLQGQQNEINTLSSDFSSIQTALGALSTAAQSNGLSAQISDPSIAGATAGAAALPGTYSLDVINLGAQENTVSCDSLTKVTDPSTGNINNSSAYTLTDEGESYTITPNGTSLDALVQAINQSGANVQATVVNVGSSTSPDYRLSIQSTDFAPAGIQLSDGSKQLLTTVTTGAYVQYQVNGEPATPVNATSREAVISPGLSVSFLGTGTTNITVAASTTAVANAIRNFVTSYNSAVSELGKNRGKNGGALSGQSIVYDLQNQLQQLTNYSAAGTGSVHSLSDLGLSFDSNGNLQFDSSALAAANPQDVLNFLGGTSTGGFLQSADSLLTGITDPSKGSLADADQTLTNELTELSSQISDQQTSLANLQQSLSTQMASADAAISSLENQVAEMTNLFTSMQQDSKNVTG
jgi:flagellar hook-associated protein 2